jgi:hypothetical protein
VPVVKQVVEVITSNDQYKIAYKNPERTPSFTKSKKNGKKKYSGGRTTITTIQVMVRLQMKP